MVNNNSLRILYLILKILKYKNAIYDIYFFVMITLKRNQKEAI